MLDFEVIYTLLLVEGRTVLAVCALHFEVIYTVQ